MPACYDLRIADRSIPFGISRNRTVAEISTAEIDDWLSGLQLAPVTRNTFRRDLRTLFSFARTRNYCADNPVIQTTRAKEVDDDVQILTVEQTAQLLNSADCDMVPFWAIGAFAGLRRSEIERLDWAQVDFESGLIEVKARQQNGDPSTYPYRQPNLRAWLAPYRTSRECLP